MYLRVNDILEIYSISRSTAYRMIKEMQELNRYPKSSIIGSGKRRRIDKAAFQDFYENMEYLRHPVMKKYVEPYKG